MGLFINKIPFIGVRKKLKIKKKKRREKKKKIKKK